MFFQCLCASGIGIHCGPPLCLGRVNCALRQWNSTVCCNKECLAGSPVGRFASPASSMTADDNGNINNNNPNQQQPQDNRDYQGSLWASRADGGPLYSLDGDGMYGVSGGRRTINGDETYPEDNVTAAFPARTQNLPSPYYPILIGLISCAPVALCIICVNAVRKYFTLRNQFPAGSFFPRRGRGELHIIPVFNNS